MRSSPIVPYLFGFGFLLLSVLVLSVPSDEIYDTYQRFKSGVIADQSDVSEHQVTTSAEIGPIDSYAYAGRLRATITFTDALGTDTVFDLNYPTDYNLFHDEYGPLYLANLRPDIANNPRVTPVLGNSCLQTIRGENLSPSPLYRTGYAEYIVCRVLNEAPPDTPRTYDISKATPAVIGVIWANKNHQPIDYPRDRCIAEMRIWSTEIAKAGDRFMACVFVVNEAPQQVEIYAFELTDDRIVEVGGEAESWPRKEVKTRAANRLVQYRLIQTWLTDTKAHEAAVERAYDHITANLDKIVPARVSAFEGVEKNGSVIQFTFRAKDTTEMFRIRDRSSGAADRHLFQHIRTLVCGSDERAALLAFQENRATYEYDLFRRNGKPMTLFATFPNMTC